MNLIDLIILLIILLGAWGGFRRGLILAAGGLLGFFGGIWLAARYYIPAAHWLGTQLGLERPLARILAPLTAGIPAAAPMITARGLKTAPGFPQSLWEPVQQATAGIHGGDLALSMADTILKVIAFLLIMACVALVVGALASLLSRIAHLLLLGGVDRLGGLCLGLVTRTLELVVVVGLLTPVVLGMSLNMPGTGGLLQGFFHAWRQSALIPLFDNGWNAVAPALKSLFQMI
jgi:uncharacterized membrane protein required for colicin V production